MLREIDPRAVVPPMTAYYVMRAAAPRRAVFPSGDPAVVDVIVAAGRYSSVCLPSRPVVAGETLEAGRVRYEELEETAELYRRCAA